MKPGKFLSLHLKSVNIKLIHNLSKTLKK